VSHLRCQPRRIFRRDALLAKLSDARGKAFDHTFIHAQLQIHKEALSLIRSYPESGRTLPLRDFAKNSLSMHEHHLSMARQLTTEDTGGLPMRTLSASRCGRQSLAGDCRWPRLVGNKRPRQTHPRGCLEVKSGPVDDVGKRQGFGFKLICGPLVPAHQEAPDMAHRKRAPVTNVPKRP
jgi:uncharacterized protein DUF4142